MNIRNLLAGFASCLAMISVAAERSLEITSVNRDAAGRIASVDMALSPGPLAVLYVAWGSSDGGDDRDAWEVCRKAAVISGSATTCRYEFPRNLGDDVKAARFFLLDDFDAPLAKQFDAIETDGSQYVWTDVRLTGRSAVEMGLSLRSVDASVALFCARTQGSSSDSFTSFYITGSGWRFDYFGVGAAVPPVATEGTKYLLRADRTGLSLDGNLISPRTATAAASMGDLLLFGAAFTRGVVPDYRPALKLSSFKTWIDSEDLTTIALDLVPTEKDGVACLYNKVDGTYFPSSAAGHPFVAGNEIPVVRAGVFSQSDSLSGRFGAERTVSVAAKRRDPATKRISGVDLAFTTGLARGLYVAWGTEDGGAALGGWQNVRRVAQIGADETAYSFDVPTDWGREVTAMRFFLVNGEYIHCEALYEGVTVENNYVSTEFVPTEHAQIRMSVAFSNVTDAQTLFCARYVASNSKSFTSFYSGGWRMDFGQKQYPTSVTAEPGTRYDITASSAGFWTTEGADPIISPEWQEFTSSKLALFVASYEHKPASGSYPFKGTLYSCQAQRDLRYPETMELDLVPCRESGRTRLYNRVDGTFLDIEGTGTVTPVGARVNGIAVATADTLPLDASGLILIFR